MRCVPGYTETDMVKSADREYHAKTGRTAEEAVAELTAHNPQKRLIQPAGSGECGGVAVPAGQRSDHRTSDRRGRRRGDVRF